MPLAGALIWLVVGPAKRNVWHEEEEEEEETLDAVAVHTNPEPMILPPSFADMKQEKTEQKRLEKSRATAEQKRLETSRATAVAPKKLNMCPQQRHRVS